MSTLPAQHEEELESHGWTVVPDLIGTGLVDAVNAALVPSIALRDAIRQRNGVMEN